MALSSSLSLLLPALLLPLAGAASIDASAASFIVNKDVVILGGGASGAHAAVRLREDYGKSVIVVENQAQLGGHVETYEDPVTGKPYDFGVNSYTEYGNSKEFFARFNVSIEVPARLTLNTTYVDFESGNELDGYVSPASADVTAGLNKYLTICEQYEDILLPSYANFPTENIPEDLLIPFSDFITKYELEVIVPRIFQVTGIGLGNMASELTIYVMQTFGAPITRSLLGLTDSFVPVSRRNQDLYDNIADLLGDDVMYSATTINSSRADNATVQLLVRGSDSKLTLINAKKLLISFSPTMENLKPFLIDTKERDVFSAWGLSHVYAGIVNSADLPINYSLVNYPESAVPTNYLELPTTPLVGRYEYLGGDNFRVLATGDQNSTTTSESAQSLVHSVFRKLQAGVIKQLSGTTGNASLEFAAWTEHLGISAHLPVEVIEGGFYRDLYALQGYRSTFYTGGAFAADFSTLLWEYNDQYLLPKLLAAL
ncbi:Uu.00g041360.m01.CDS01 [Anthostomella pinea]|uniref:Uu.00g041360.m01.CDS01 n=1 Tax=Anthostomella pinea TaxID=933095 RepID=A0AAI8VAH9_9PEZI|nr:Uu.00g041360.m01.CDS01 [Anthostomella pinea]